LLWRRLFFLKTGSIRLWLGVIEFVICSTFLGKGKNFQRRHKQNTRNWNEKKICSSKKCENVKVGSVFGIENVPIRLCTVLNTILNTNIIHSWLLHKLLYLDLEHKWQCRLTYVLCIKVRRVCRMFSIQNVNVYCDLNLI
jgi:hypothetical protein